MTALLPADDFEKFPVPTAPLGRLSWCRLARVDQSELIEWAGRAGITRFVPAAPAFEMLYLAQRKRTAFWEVYAKRLLALVKEDRVLPPSALTERQWVNFELPAGLVVFGATKIDCVREIGASNASFHGDWSASQAWSAALWRHPRQVDRILYRSDKDTPYNCLALFRRPGRALLDRINATKAGLLGDDTAFLQRLRKKGDLA